MTASSCGLRRLRTSSDTMAGPRAGRAVARLYLPEELTMTSRHGPLAGFRILEIGAIGPGPFCAMLLADLGAEVIRLDRSAERAMEAVSETPLLARGRRSIALDLKKPEGLATLLRMVEQM